MKAEARPDVVCSVAVSNYLGETPVWSAAEQCLYWVNVQQEPALHRWSPSTDEHRSWPMPERIGGLVLRRKGLLLVLASGLYDFDCHSAALRLRVPSPLPSHVKLHECVTDRQGRLWVGGYDHRLGSEPGIPTDAKFFRLDGDRLTPVIEGITVANGLAFSPDGRTLYASDSITRRVDAWHVDPASGAISNRRPFLKLPREAGMGHIDGATTDDAGGYWLALMYGSALQRYRPDGTLDRTLSLPFSSPTKATFGGPDLDTLFITSTQMRLGPELPPGFELNGPVYSCRPGFRGLAEVPLAE